MSASPNFESGLKNHRIEYVKESTVGTAPSNPSWDLFSDVVLDFGPDDGADISQIRGLGDADIQAAFAGTESPSLSITYYLQKKTSSGNTFLDGSGNPNDAATDGLQRDSDNRIQNTHTVVDRYTQSGIAAANTWNGSTSRDTRQYIVANGGYIDEVTIVGDPESGEPTTVELSYEFEKVRRYRIDQPDSAIEIWANSTDASDTSQTLTVEDEDAGTTETIDLNGTTDVGPTTATFADIDALSLDAETVGDVRVYVDDGTGTAKGDQISTIYGQDSYDHGEGSTGVPALGSGSHGSISTDIKSGAELYHDDEVEQPDGTTIADNFEATEFTVSNNIDGTNRGGTSRRALSATGHDVTVDVTVYGETEIQTRVSESLRTTTGNVRWTMEGGYVQADNASVEADPDEFGAEQSKATTSLTFTGQGLTISA